MECPRPTGSHQSRRSPLVNAAWWNDPWHSISKTALPRRWPLHLPSRRHRPAAGFAPGDLRVEQRFDRFFGESAERARQFAQKRADEVNEQMLASLARRHKVPVDELQEGARSGPEGAGGSRRTKTGPPRSALTRRSDGLFPHRADGAANHADGGPRVCRASTRCGRSLHRCRDTILWQPVIVLPTDGKAKLQFHLGNAPGGYQVVVAGHTLDGRIGAVRGIIPVTPPQLTTPTAPPGQPAPVPPPAP